MNLLIGLGVHEYVVVTFFVEILDAPRVELHPLDILLGTEATVDHGPATQIAQPCLHHRLSLAWGHVLIVVDSEELSVDLNDHPLT